jgi:hypothetical protein
MMAIKQGIQVIAEDDQPIEDVQLLRADLEDFVVDVSVGLPDDYRAAAELAKSGKYPATVVPSARSIAAATRLRVDDAKASQSSTAEVR